MSLPYLIQEYLIEKSRRFTYSPTLKRVHILRRTLLCTYGIHVGSVSILPIIKRQCSPIDGEEMPKISQNLPSIP